MKQNGKLTPRGKEDYIPLFRWLIGKRFAYILAVGLIIFGIAGLILLSPIRFPDRSNQYRIFNYDSWLLKFHKGKAGIRAASGYIAYIGDVAGGTANGEGILYYENGAAAYEGNFSDGMYHGSGKQYDTGANLIYEGNFIRNQVVYEELVGKETSEVAGKYHGEQQLYNWEQIMCVYMPGIEAVYYAASQEEALKEEWITQGIYVLRQDFLAGEEVLHTMTELESYFGPPEYTGATAAEFQDTVVAWIWKSLQGESSEPKLEMEETLRNVYQVTEFEQKYELMISTFVKDGYLYTFFADEEGEGFSFYLIEEET